jgi:DNA-binding NarL/FixJ family response regulator
MKKSLSPKLYGTDRRDRRYGSASYAALSPREREVMFLAANGFANKEIARELKVTEGTIKLHLHRVFQKLGIKSRFALTVLVRQHAFERDN